MKYNISIFLFHKEINIIKIFRKCYTKYLYIFIQYILNLVINLLKICKH